MERRVKDLSLGGFQDTQQLYHPVSGQCLDCDAARREIFMSRCSDQTVTQRWRFEKVNETQVRHEWAS